VDKKCLQVKVFKMLDPEISNAVNIYRTPQFMVMLLEAYLQEHSCGGSAW
jgi:hypothetical protein